MSEHGLHYLANCSLLFTELPVNQRPHAAKAAGFDAIEFWWPFATATPRDTETDAFVSAIGDAGVRLVGLNFAGDLAGPDCGVLSLPARAGEFLDNLDIAVGIGDRLGVSAFNALYGNRVDDVTPAAQDDLATDNLLAAAAAAGRIGATVLVEAVSGPKPYPLRTADDAVAVVQRVRAAGAANVGFLCDLFHLAANGDDLSAAISGHIADIAHVQLADWPGRGEPGTGQLDLDGCLAQLQGLGYGGWVGLEYKPSVPTIDSLSWLPRERRASTVKETS